MLTTKHASSRKRPLQVALRRFSKDVNGDKLGVVQTLETHERLDEQRLRVPVRAVGAVGERDIRYTKVRIEYDMKEGKDTWTWREIRT